MGGVGLCGNRKDWKECFKDLLETKSKDIEARGVTEWWEGVKLRRRKKRVEWKWVAVRMERVWRIRGGEALLALSIPSPTHPLPWRHSSNSSNPSSSLLLCISRHQRGFGWLKTIQTKPKKENNTDSDLFSWQGLHIWDSPLQQNKPPAEGIFKINQSF